MNMIMYFCVNILEKYIHQKKKSMKLDGLV